MQEAFQVQPKGITLKSGHRLLSRCTYLGDSGWFYVLTTQVNFERVNLLSHYNLSYPSLKTSKYGITTLVLPSRLFVMDLTICMDIQENPGPELVENRDISRSNDSAVVLNLPAKNTKQQ